MSRAGLRSPKPTASSASMAGIAKRSRPSACSAAKPRGAFLAVYTAKVRLTVRTQDRATIVREGHGTGEGRGSSVGEAHDVALKAAETDATKRALVTFGKAFGLALYAKRVQAGAIGVRSHTMQGKAGEIGHDAFDRGSTVRTQILGQEVMVVPRRPRHAARSAVHRGEPPALRDPKRHSSQRA